MYILKKIYNVISIYYVTVRIATLRLIIMHGLLVKTER